MAEQLRIIISGGGTGGHIFPAVSIAREIQARYPQARILFVGAEGRMEMERVPAAGFPIEGIRIAGFQRKKLLANLSLPGKIWSSLKRVRAIMERERPHLVIGTGGYVSGPTLWMAQRASDDMPMPPMPKKSRAGMAPSAAGCGFSCAMSKGVRIRLRCRLRRGVSRACGRCRAAVPVRRGGTAGRARGHTGWQC